MVALMAGLLTLAAGAIHLKPYMRMCPACGRFVHGGIALNTLLAGAFAEGTVFRQRFIAYNHRLISAPKPPQPDLRLMVPARSVEPVNVLKMVPYFWRSRCNGSIRRL